MSNKHKSHDDKSTKNDTLNPGSDDTLSAATKAENEATSSDPKTMTADPMSQDGPGEAQPGEDPQPAFGEGPAFRATQRSTGAVEDTAEQRSPAADPGEKLDPYTGLRQDDPNSLTGSGALVGGATADTDRTGSKADTAAQRSPAADPYAGMDDVSGLRGKHKAAALGLEDGEQASSDVAKNPGGRVSLQSMKDQILSVHHITGDKLVEASDSTLGVQGGVNQETLTHTRGLSICLIVLKNGYTIVGKSAVADPVNFDADLGRKFAFDDALRQLWPILGYAKRQELHQR